MQGHLFHFGFSIEIKDSINCKSELLMLYSWRITITIIHWAHIDVFNTQYCGVQICQGNVAFFVLDYLKEFIDKTQWLLIILITEIVHLHQYLLAFFLWKHCRLGAVQLKEWECLSHSVFYSLIHLVFESICQNGVLLQYIGLTVL